MEIPAGKYCYRRGAGVKSSEGCPFTYMYESDDGSLNACLHPDFADDTAEDVTYLPLRSPACLAAYPNGAVITIKPKEAPCK